MGICPYCEQMITPKADSIAPNLSDKGEDFSTVFVCPRCNKILGIG